MTRAYIATMPRSGSAWLANLFNVAPGISTATHEPIRRSWRADHSIEWPEVDWTHTVVGCDLSLWPGVIPPGADRVVVVDRPDDEVFHSVMEATYSLHSERLIEECRRGIEQLKRRPGVLTVEFWELFDPLTVERIENRLGVWLDANRTRDLLGVNVQAIIHGRRYTAGPNFEAFLLGRLS